MHTAYIYIYLLTQNYKYYYASDEYILTYIYIQPYILINIY